MLPNNNDLTIFEDKKEFIHLDDTLYNKFISPSKGGINLGDPSQGLFYQTWVLKYTDGKFILSNEYGFELKIAEISDTDTIEVTKVSLSFDQNMKYVWAYSYTEVSSGNSNSKMYWYNVSSNSYEELFLRDTRDVSVQLDDVRSNSNNINDIVLSYINIDNRLCIRYQRERYLKTHSLLKLPPNAIITKAGLTKDYRFQFEIRVPETVKHTDKNFILGSI